MRCLPHLPKLHWQLFLMHGARETGSLVGESLGDYSMEYHPKLADLKPKVSAKMSICQTGRWTAFPISHLTKLVLSELQNVRNFINLMKCVRNSSTFEQLVCLEQVQHTNKKHRTSD